MSDVEEALRGHDGSGSSLPVLSRFLFGVARWGDVRLACPDAVVEGDVVRCFVAEYTLVGKVFATVLVLADLFRLPAPVVRASASSPSVPSDVLAGRFTSPGYAESLGGYWWVSVQTVDDDGCDPQPYTLNLDVTAGIFALDAAVTVLDDGDPAPLGSSAPRCARPGRLEALDAAAAEGDGAAAFTVRASGPAPQADVSVDYALVSGSAAASGDYGDVSGTLRLPAGTRHATVSVPLTDDSAVEGVESFGLVLSNPVGATLADASATATITDDDAGAVPAAAPAASVCERAALSGSAGDVFDIAQPGFAGRRHAFVDVDVTCGAGSPVGLPVAVEAVEGPQSSLGLSAYCLTAVAARTVTAPAAAGCETLAAPRTIGAVRGRSTHLLAIPDASVGKAHQLLVWIDADRDRTHDRGEPYQYVAADFVGRSVGGGTLVDFGLADDFAVEVVAGGSDRIGRSGRHSELRLRLHTTTRMARSAGEPVTAAAPIANALVGAAVTAGPSAGAEVMCLHTSRTSSQCRTDADGQIIVRYRVGHTAVSALRRAQDVIAVFHDPDQNGRRAHGAATSFLARPVAKTVNYVALGDSYSSGEQGHPDLAGFTGSYQNGVSPADQHCRRWSEAYPNVFADDILRAADPNIDIKFRTHACTGA
ncbi:MAG: hypothetical protein OXF61_16880, partial [Acidimicrobiaceae bacterium]|nr:hypothetical protein [Acidimicrobiaceae bacterium]